MSEEWGVVVVGGGHAGCEAALAAARLGVRTLLITGDPGSIGRMSCNPAIGGLAKGQVVREVDALGGAMAGVADRTGIQFKVLNGSRGPAVRGLRCQSDKARYAAAMRGVVERAPGVSVVEGLVAGLRLERGRLRGLVLADGREIRGRTAVVTTGTFLGGLVHVGAEKRAAGRWGEPPARGLSEALRALGLRLGRMKTGTPPRVRSNSIDRSIMSASPGDARPTAFSFRTRGRPFPLLPQELCWLTYTTGETHELIRRSLGRSPLYSGEIVGRGPRYCPSIEDKVVRFPERERHQIFVEPEGLDTDWIYLNGLSMSFPPELQEAIVRTLPGLSEAEILRPAYAVEYDMVQPDQLDDRLAVRDVPGLFLAGQINGTSGYEEAAGQGLVAGANAAQEVLDREPLVLGRHEAYIGVMIDDLVTLGTEEPYRLLTSRAEHRLLLDADSAYRRLTPRALALGLLAPEVAGPILEREARLAELTERAEATAIRPDAGTVARLAEEGVELREQTTVAGLLRRPEACPGPFLEAVLDGLSGLAAEDRERFVNELRYAGFVKREAEAVARMARETERRIPAGFVYRGLPGLSAEAVEKLERHRPRTLGQAGRIPGVTPAAITLLLARLVAASRRGAAA